MQAQIPVDSAKIVQLNDTLHGVALYGVFTPNLPCAIIDSSKVIGADTTRVFICYLSASALSVGCKASDTVLLGNLHNTYHTIIVALARTDTTNNTCSNPSKRDTIALYYAPTDVMDMSGYNSTLIFSNPVTNMLTGKIEHLTSNIHLHVLGLDGQCIIPNLTITQPNFEIDVSALPSGLYFLQLWDGKQQTIKKFVKN